MSSLYKFENKVIDKTNKDELRSYLANAKKELVKLRTACGFDESVVIIEDRSLVKVSLVCNAFSLAVRHGEQSYKTTIKLFKNGSVIQEISLANLYNPKLIDQLKALV
jgi:hypothetical protein